MKRGHNLKKTADVYNESLRLQETVHITIHQCDQKKIAKCL